MLIRRITFLAALLLIAAFAAFSQQIGGGGGFGVSGGMSSSVAGGGMSGGSSGNCDNTSCTMRFSFSGSGGGVMQMAAVTGAPYSGRQSSENVRTLPNGTHITNPSAMSGMTYRDSQGRVRTERPMFPAPAGRKAPIDVTVIQIQDPVAGFLYVLDTVNHVAHRMPVQARPLPVPAINGTPPPSPAGYTSASESLGTQVMFGVVLTGRKTTSTTPAGSPMGNDQPLTTISENWTDPRTNVLVFRKSTSPNGDSTMTMQNYSNTEPDPALFQIPAGYQVADENGTFTMVFPLSK